MKYKFTDLVDISKLQKLMEAFYLTSNILSAVLDIDANILIAVGWRDICVKFHRANLETEILCKQSDLYIKKHIKNINKNSKEKTIIYYTCANGLVDVAAPIIIDGEHLATVYTGQFLFEEPDREQFRKQAGKYGFNEEEYLDSLKNVPIYPKEKVESFMHFFLQLADMLAQMGLSQLRLIESQKKVLRESESLLRKSQKVARIGNIVMDIGTLTWKATTELYDIAGIDETYPHTAKGWNKLIHPDYRRKASDYFFEVKAEKVPYDYEYKIIRFMDGEERWVYLLGDFEFDNLGNAVRLIVTVQDITKRKIAEEALRESERFLRESQKAAHIGSFAIDLKNQTWKGSPEMNEIFGIDETYPRTVRGWDALVHPDWLKKCLHYYLKVKAEKIPYNYEYEIIRYNDGEKRWVHGLANLEFDKQSNPVRLIGTFHDITNRKKAEEEIIYLSYHDKLTGLYNRRFYEEEIKRLDTERNLPISIIIGDVNGLKLVNDAFGHAKGDELLQKAARAIQSACRTDDIVARWGGDEFVILLPKTKSEEVEGIIKRIKEQYSNEYINSLSFSISFGCDTKNNPDENILKVLKSAEDYMYKHKIIENESMRSTIINTIIKTLHEKNPREELHSKRVSEICQKIGKALGFSEIEINRLKVVGLLHDIGKIAIEEGILNKPEKLTDQEWDEIKRHPDIGYRILSTSYDMLELADCILAHHERWDGTGYPKGLKGEAIPRVARIIALADSYDAMTSERPYRKALSEEEAINEIRKNSGIQYDPEIARIFVEKVL